MSGRQVQLRIDLNEARIPPGNGHIAPCVAAAQGFQIDTRLPDFDPGLSFFVTVGNQQILAVFHGRKQRVGTGHVQPPGGTHLAANLVVDDETASVKVEPECPAE